MPHRALDTQEAALLTIGPWAESGGALVITHDLFRLVVGKLIDGNYGGRGGGGRGGSWAQQRPDVAENISRLLLDPETAEPVTKASSTTKKKAIAARVCVDCYERAFRAANLENETRQRVVSCPGGSLEDENAHRLRNAEESSEDSCSEFSPD